MWLPDQAYCMPLRLAYCRLFASLIVAYWLGYLWLIGQAYYGLFAWFFVTYCRLLTAYWSGHLRLIGQAYYNTLSAY